MRALALVFVLACGKTAKHEQPKSFTELFAGTTAPSLTGPVLGGIDWRANYAQIENQLRTHNSGGLTYGTIGDMSSRLDTVIITSTETRDPEPDLAKLWGPPALVQPQSDGLRKVGSKVWFGDHVLALLAPDPWTLRLLHYVPLADELGAPNEPRFGFERGGPLIGATEADVEKRYDDILQRNGGARPTTLQLPDDELARFTVTVQYDDKSVVSEWQAYVTMTKDLPKRRDVVLGKFGKSTLTDEETVRGFDWSGYRVHVIADQPDGLWSINVQRP